MSEPSVEAVVRRVWAETPHLTGVVVEVPAEVAARYQRPGQVVKVHAPAGKPVYLALAGNPGEARSLELLLGPAAKSALAPEEGAAWHLEPPFGSGFPLDAAAGRDLLVFAVGSALAPIRALVEAVLRDRARYGRVALYVGAHTEADLPYAEDLARWASDGVEVRRSVSRPWVQDVFRHAPPPFEDPAAFVCGMPDMVKGVTEALLEAGVAAERIGKNW
jgi:sulfhydrogenase subunit gamma (sulfur reductase)